MTVQRAATSILLACLILPAAARAGGEQASADTAVRIGVYDSRSVAIAYAGTARFRDIIREGREKYEAAMAADDKELMEKLDREAGALQLRLHRQAFSTAPVDDILERIAGKLPAIMEKHAISAIISKWDEKRLAELAGAERIDVTMDLVDALGPDDVQRKYAVEIQASPPVPPEELRGAGLE